MMVFENLQVRSRYEFLYIGDKEYDLNKLPAFSGIIRSMAFKRDAMGFGDVKFMACIGAFLGWQATLFTIIAASCIGALVGIAGAICRRREWSAKIPFGPYLALAAMLWVFFSTDILAWWKAYYAFSVE